MASTIPSPVAATEAANPWSMLAWPAVLAQSLCQMQRAQFDAISAWQQTVGGLGQEMWDEWVAHWGGGVPLEG
jgi:hypothetical protein